MSELVRAAVVVSDGILVEFETGECCYYPASFLMEHQLTKSNHIFLNYDPCADAAITARHLPACISGAEQVI